MTTTTAPRWVKLDELASQDLRAALANFVERMETYAEPTESEVREALSLCERYYEETNGKGLPHGFILDVNVWAGFEAFERVCERVGIELPE